MREHHIREERAQPAERASRRERGGRTVRLVRRASMALLVGGIAGIAGVFWWEVLRDRQPAVEGEIDERALAMERLCVGAVEPPCREVELVERTIRSAALRVAAAERASDGNQGVIALALQPERGPMFKAKWRPLDSESLFNIPAKELAAYEVQRLLLAPVDYVVPPVSSHCFELEHYREKVVAAATPLSGTQCVLGFLSYWVDGATSLRDLRREGRWPMPPEGAHAEDPRLFDAERFARDPEYRRNIAILNLVLYLVGNRDAHAGQFVIYEEPWHAFVIDNSLSFDALPNPTTLFMQDLSQLIVPAIPADVAARIAPLEREALEPLSAIEEHEERDGLLVAVPVSAPFARDVHVRRRDRRVQIGLTDRDLSELWARVESLQRALAEGRLATF